MNAGHQKQGNSNATEEKRVNDFYLEGKNLNIPCEFAVIDCVNLAIQGVLLPTCLGIYIIYGIDEEEEYFSNENECKNDNDYRDSGPKRPKLKNICFEKLRVGFSTRSNP